MYTLAIDLGSSYMKYAVIAQKDQSIVTSKTMSEYRRVPSAEPAHFALDLTALSQQILEIIHGVAKEYTLTKLFFSTQMHGYVYETANKTPVYVSWQDSRCTLPLFPENKSALDILKNRISPEQMQHCGVYFKPSMGFCNLYAALYGEKSEALGGTLYTLGSYLIHMLTGRNMTHPTNAAPLGFFHLTALEFDRILLAQADLAHINLPEIAENDFTICGYYTCNGQNIAVFPDYGDQQVSLLGAGAEEDDIVFNLATAGQLCFVTKDLVSGPYEIRPYFHNLYLYTISNLPSGRNLQVLISFFQSLCTTLTGQHVAMDEIWSKIQTLSLSPSTLTVNTHFYPTTEGNTDGGAITHITPENLTLEHLMHGTYEDMIATYLAHFAVITAHHTPKGLILSGGVSQKNTYLAQNIAARVGLPRKQSTMNEVFAGFSILSDLSSSHTKE